MSPESNFSFPRKYSRFCFHASERDREGNVELMCFLFGMTIQVVVGGVFFNKVTSEKIVFLMAYLSRGEKKLSPTTRNKPYVVKSVENNNCIPPISLIWAALLSRSGLLSSIGKSCFFLQDIFFF